MLYFILISIWEDYLIDAVSFGFLASALGVLCEGDEDDIDLKSIFFSITWILVAKVCQYRQFTTIDSIRFYNIFAAPTVLNLIKMNTFMILNNEGLQLTNSNFVNFYTVILNKDGIIEISGLHDIMVEEVVNTKPEQADDLVLSVTINSSSAIVLGEDTSIVHDMLVTSTSNLLHVPVGEALLGRVVDTLGQPVDGLGIIDSDIFHYIETKAPGFISRKSVHESMQAGILAIDLKSIFFSIMRIFVFSLCIITIEYEL